MKPRAAVVLVSGGLDSAVSLAIAQRDGFVSHALSVDYGQRHRAELIAAARVAAALDAASHRTVAVDLRSLGGSALTDASIAVPKGRSEAEIGHGIPVSYVPARNTVFLAIATAAAEAMDADAVFLGINALDYSGYPDCRPEFLDAFREAARLGTKRGVDGRPIQFVAPFTLGQTHFPSGDGSIPGIKTGTPLSSIPLAQVTLSISFVARRNSPVFRSASHLPVSG